MLESPNSEATGGSDVQSTSDRQASVWTEAGPWWRGCLFAHSQEDDISLTDGQGGMVMKPKKAKSQKHQGVKTSGSGGTELPICFWYR